MKRAWTTGSGWKSTAWTTSRTSVYLNKEAHLQVTHKRRRVNKVQMPQRSLKWQRLRYSCRRMELLEFPGQWKIRLMWSQMYWLNQQVFSYPGESTNRRGLPLGPLWLFRKLDINCCRWEAEKLSQLSDGKTTNLQMKWESFLFVLIFLLHNQIQHIKENHLPCSLFEWIRKLQSFSLWLPGSPVIMVTTTFSHRKCYKLQWRHTAAFL